MKKNNGLLRKWFRNLLKKQMNLLQRLKQNKMDLLVKSNALRSKSREKCKEMEHEEKNIDGLQKKLKLM